MSANHHPRALITRRSWVQIPPPPLIGPAQALFLDRAFSRLGGATDVLPRPRPRCRFGDGWVGDESSEDRGGVGLHAQVV